MRILFMGTPDFAMISLKAIYESNEEIVGVVTTPDKAKGRGMVLTPSPVKKYATEMGLPVYQPQTLKDGAFLDTLKELDPELIVVVAYGKILPTEVIDFPRYGCINAHVSLLPKYRGAAPMQRAIMEGEKETGVTIMYMDEGLDTGDIITSVAFPITEADDFEAIHDRSAEIGSKLLSDTVTALFDGTAKRIKQDDALATYAKKVEKEDCKLDFTLSASKLDFQIRGVTPIPGAFAYLNGKMLKINRATPVKGVGKCGEVIEVSDKGEGYFTVACGEGALKVSVVIPEGKGKMSAGDFIRGRKIQIGDILTK